MAIPRPRYGQKKKRRGGKFERGFYHPINEGKYRPPLDRTMNNGIYPEYRSSWERKFYKWCDCSPKIDYWSTEAVAVPYISPKDNQKHRYFPDVFLHFKSGQKVIVEIKPNSQRNCPINLAKWESADRYAKSIGASFVVVTEKHLQAWGIL